MAIDQLESMEDEAGSVDSSGLCVFLFSVFAVGGFYFVGELRYQELDKTNNNCTLARNHLLGIS
ncbi:hypothetical protein BDD12DRAFT_888461 [Trichophaea hybrida]|nr:hypothetical protein BDD12DRAFT_888461 [Trichophaea hybrida]